MKRLHGALLAALLAGCGKLSTTPDGVAYLEITSPPSLTLDVGTTVQFTARALDGNGDPVEVEITWRTPDTTITVDESGLVTGVSAGPGRVQAAVKGSERLVSEFIPLTVRDPPAAAGPGR